MLLLFLLALSLQAPQKDSAAADRAQSPATNQRGSDSLPFSVKLLNTGKTEADAAQEAERIQSEERTQTRTLVLSVLVVLMTVVQVVILGRQTFLISESVSVMKEQEGWMKTSAEEARVAAIATKEAAAAAKKSADAAVAAQRPWIEAKVSLRGPLVIAKDKIEIMIGVQLRNVGNSPAVNVHVVPEMVTVPMRGTMDLWAAVKGAVAKSDTMENAQIRTEIGSTIFPQSEPTTVRHGIQLFGQEVRDEFEAASKDANYRFLLLIAGCVNYRFGDDRGRTVFNLIVRERDSESLGLKPVARTFDFHDLQLDAQYVGAYAQ